MKSTRIWKNVFHHTQQLNEDNMENVTQSVVKVLDLHNLQITSIDASHFLLSNRHKPVRDMDIRFEVDGFQKSYKLEGEAFDAIIEQIKQRIIVNIQTEL